MRSSRRWEPGGPEGPAPCSGPRPLTRPRPQGYKGSRRKGAGLPREAEVPSRGFPGSALLVSLRSCGGRRAAFCGGVVGWGHRAPRPLPNRRGLAGSGRWLLDVLPGVGRGAVWERA